MLNSLWFLLLCVLASLVTQTSLSSFVDERIPICPSNSTVKGHILLVQRGEPMNGKVLTTATVLPSIGNVSTCDWTFYLDGSMFRIKDCDLDTDNILRGSFVTLAFSHPGLKELTVAAAFFININTPRSLLRNCTFVNVSDCSRQLNLAVSTSKDSFNISRNHRKLTLDSPGMVNFTILVFNVKDPFHFCHPLYYKWSFGDGQYLLNTRDNNVNHFYNSSGLFFLVLDIFKDKDENNFYKNISMTVHVKEELSSDSNTGIDVILVLAICLAIVVLVGGLVIFRKKVHKFTEVARFDFRDEDFPSTTTSLYYKQGCLRRLFPGRREENECLFAGMDPYSSRQSFGSTLPTDEY